MPRIQEQSLERLNRSLDAEWFLSKMGARNIQHCGPELRAFCPIHGSDNQPSLSIRLEDNIAICHNTGCPAHEGGTLIWLWSLRQEINIRQATEELAEMTNFQLEYEEKTPAPEEFIYREIGGKTEEGKFWRRVLVTKPHPVSPQLDSYVSGMAFSIGDISELTRARREGTAFMLGEFMLDFDNPFPEEGIPGMLKETPFERIKSFRDGAELALLEMRQVIRFLIREGIPEDIIEPFFSGRGFHLSIKPQAFGARPSTDLHHIYRHLAYIIAGVEDTAKEKVVLERKPDGTPTKKAFPARLLTIDQGVFNSDRLWRMNNTRNSKSGLYKTRLTVKYVSNFSINQILNLARCSQPLPLVVEVRETIPDARKLFIRAWKRMKSCESASSQESREVHNLPGNAGESPSSPESCLARQGYGLALVNPKGKLLKGSLSPDLITAAVELARREGKPVYFAVKKGTSR